MAGKPNLTPRERKVVSELASEDYVVAMNHLEELKEVVSVIQDALFFKSLGVKVDNVELRQLFKQMESFYEGDGITEVSQVIAARNSSKSTKKVMLKK